MERPAGVARIEQDALTVADIIGQSLRQIFMAHRRRGDDDQVDALHHRRQMRAHEIWRGLFANAAFDQLDLAELGQFRDRAFRTREQSHLEPAQGEIGRRGATAVAGAENCDFLNGHQMELSGRRFSGRHCECLRKCGIASICLRRARCRVPASTKRSYRRRHIRKALWMISS